MQPLVPQWLSAALPPPRYLSLPTIGLDLASGSLKYAEISLAQEGLHLSHFGSHLFDQGTIEDGDITKEDTVVSAIQEVLVKDRFHFAHLSLPEQKSYLFSLELNRGNLDSMKEEAASLLESHVPLPPNEVMFDIIPLHSSGPKERVVGVAYARRIVSVYKSTCEKAGLFVRGLEPEVFAVSRAVTRKGDDSTSLIIDMGKTSTKFIVTQGQVPVYTASLAIGGHSLTQAVQKHFNVDEKEAVRIKIEQGIARTEGELLSSLLSTLSAIREEVTTRFEYWQKKAKGDPHTRPIERILLVGGNANVKGLPEYLMASLGMPVTAGNVFCNLASFDDHLPDIEKNQSLTYAVSIGLALRSYD
jgi:type IV pilus assembly protein PilM